MPADEKLTCQYFLNVNFEHGGIRLAKARIIEAMNLFVIPKCVCILGRPRRRWKENPLKFYDYKLQMSRCK
jgi:hypothetical protein